MTREEANTLNHRVKNVAHVMMGLQHELDKLIKEIEDIVVNEE